MKICLGIDIGTTKVAVVLVDAVSGELLQAEAKSSLADVGGLPEAYAEQSPSAIMAVCEELIGKLDADRRAEVTAIGVTGQMHGVVCWNETETSNLITWKDRRASGDGTLERFRDITGDRCLKDGFGAVSLAWLAENELLSKWRSAATIHDYLVACFCGLARPLTDPGNAASWGMFDLFSSEWQTEKFKKLRISPELLPTIVPTGSRAGELVTGLAEKFGVPTGIPVSVAIGDNQASILATMGEAEKEIYLTLGTGAQLSIVVDRSSDGLVGLPDSVELRPFLADSLLMVAAPLCGGQAFAWLVQVVRDWQQSLGLPVAGEDELFRQIDRLALASLDSPLFFQPSFLGERHQPEQRCEIRNINLTNFSLGNVAASLGRGIIENMYKMFPEGAFAGRVKVIGSGNGVRKLAVIREMIGRVFGLPLELVSCKEEAAVGAALLAGRY